MYYKKVDYLFQKILLDLDIPFDKVMKIGDLNGFSLIIKKYELRELFIKSI